MKAKITIVMDVDQALLLGSLLGQIPVVQLGNFPREFVDLHKALTNRPTICGSISVRGEIDKTIDMREEE